MFYLNPGMITGFIAKGELMLTSMMIQFLSGPSTQINPNIDLNALFGGVMDIIIQIAFYVGVVMVGGGVFNLLVAYKDEDGNAQTKAVRYLVVGGTLIGLPALLQMTGIIQLGLFFDPAVLTGMMAEATENVSTLVTTVHPLLMRAVMTAGLIG